MRKLFLGIIAAVAWNIGGASAATVVNGQCASVADSDGCLFSGNISISANGSNSYVLAQNAYDTYNNSHFSAGPDITLTPITDTAGGGLATLTGAGGTSGTWSLAGYSVDYIAVKAGNYFDLYELATPASSGTWDTYDLPGLRGYAPALSHIVFFGSQISNLNSPPSVNPGGTITNAVPEPGTWVMMLLGFGLIGGVLRARRTIQVLPSP